MKRPAVYLTALILVVGGGNLYWTARVAQENNHAWCSLITSVAPPGYPPPATARQRAVVRALQERARSLGC